MNIAFIGYGNMARALIQGFEKNKTLTLRAASPSLKPGQIGSLSCYCDNKAAIAGADILFLTVKPAKMADVLSEIGPLIPPKAVVISVAAGVSLSFIQSFCVKEQAIIRCMPNLPHAVRLGATPLAANQALTAAQKQQVEALFQSAGIYTWVNEAQLNAFTAVSGSGPAYVFLLIEALVAAATKLGIEEAQATDFVSQTVQGAAVLLQESGLSAKALREKVTSPAGTTAAALDVLQAKGFSMVIDSAVNAAFNRANELGSIDTA